MKKQAEEEAKKKAEEAKKVKQAAAKAEAKALLGLGKKKSSGGAVGGEAVGAAASTVEEKDEEERMEVRDGYKMIMGWVESDGCTIEYDLRSNMLTAVQLYHAGCLFRGDGYVCGGHVHKSDNYSPLLKSLL